MLTELDPAAFAQLEPLYRRSAHHLVIRSIAARHTPARAWADDPAAPRCALVWDRMSGLYLAGTADQPAVQRALSSALKEIILPDAARRGIPEMECFYDDAAWEPALTHTILNGQAATPARFNSFRLAQPTLANDHMLTREFSLLPVDRQLLARHGLGHLDHLTGWILSFYASLEDFLKIGIGYVALNERDQAIASLCISVFVAHSLSGSGGEYELGLATAPEYRQRGLATATAAACVRHCQQRGDLPVWHCWADNIASVRTAERVGFEITGQSPALRFNLTGTR